MRTFKAPPPREAGYALLAAVAGIAVFGYIAFAMLAAERGGLAGTIAQGQRARLSAAADAGLALAASSLTASEFGQEAWRIDGRPYHVRFDGFALTIRIEDERGKILINQLSEDQARLMFQSAGIDGRRLDEVTDAFLDWIDVDNDRRPYGAEADDYAALGYRPRNGPLRSLSELGLIRGIDRPLYDRIAPAATLFFGGAGAFSPPTGHPLAIAVMTGTGMGSPQVIERQRAIAGQRVAIDLSEGESLTARPLTVRVVAEDGQRGRLERATIIEFPRGPAGGWEIRYEE